MTDSNYTLSDIAAATGGNGGMFGGNGDWGAWIILFLLFGLFGRGGFGFGDGNGGNCGERCATPADLTAQGIVGKLDGITTGICDSTYALNNAVTGGFRDISAQFAECCCGTQRAIDGVNFNLAKGFCDLGNVVNNGTRDILENNNANTRAILDFLTNDKIATLTAENQSLKFAASQANQNAFITANQEAQTAELIRRLGRDCPVPAYVVPNPNCCYNPLGFNYGNGFGNTGCGCGC